ncbi:MAG: AraC family transcriptional regulator [Saccharofermentanales bacterium]
MAMLPEYENIIKSSSTFPVDVFVQDNLKEQVNVHEHFHDCFELLYFLSGEARQFINGRSFTAQKDDIILIRSGDIHSTCCERNADCRILVLKFMPSMLDSGYLMMEGSKYLAAFLNYVTTSEIKGLSAGELDELRSVLINMLDEYSDKQKAYEIRIKGYILETVALLVRYNLVNIPNRQVSGKDISRIETVVQIIEKNYSQPLTLEDIAISLRMNYSYVSRYFKKVTGKNFKAYLDYIRICEAERMLLQKKGFIYEVSEKCGFASVQAFNRVYRRIRGCTPTEMMKM